MIGKNNLKKNQKYNQIIKYIYIKLFSYIPFIRKDRLFVNILNKENLTGPGRFLFNLEDGLKKRNLLLERKYLKKCKSTLIISTAPSHFYDFCEKRNISTILRVDGFSLPILYDNNLYENRTQRFMTYERLKINHEVQVGLLKSTYVIYQSQFSRKIANQYLFNRTDKYSIIYNGVNTDHFKPNPHKHTKTLLTLGVLGKIRDIDIIKVSLESFRITYSMFPVQLYLIGTLTTEVHEFVLSWLKKNQYLSQNVKIFGTINYDTLPHILNDIDISLHLTSGDASPNAVLENLSCGNPVVCLEWGGSSELVGEAGCIIPQKPYDYGPELTNKVVEAISTIKTDLENLSLKARERAISKFSLDKMIEEYVVIIKMLNEN